MRNLRGILYGCSILCLIGLVLDDACFDPEYVFNSENCKPYLIKAFWFAFVGTVVYYAYKCWETAD
jgi:hypothetical protein